jgi:hypothetical protein
MAAAVAATTEENGFVVSLLIASAAIAELHPTAANVAVPPPPPPVNEAPKLDAVALPVFIIKLLFPKTLGVCRSLGVAMVAICCAVSFKYWWPVC